ncbi:MAG: hypothetical protein ACRD47_08695, partial [Nitrososphaeraceae archaeon]
TRPSFTQDDIIYLRRQTDTPNFQYGGIRGGTRRERDVNLVFGSLSPLINIKFRLCVMISQLNNRNVCK